MSKMLDALMELTLAEAYNELETYARLLELRVASLEKEIEDLQFKSFY